MLAMNMEKSYEPEKRQDVEVILLLFYFCPFFFLFSGYSKIVSSSGSELSHYSQCQYGYSNGLIGQLVEVPFNGSSFLTAKVKLYYKGSVVRSEFAILEAGKGLGSGKF